MSKIKTPAAMKLWHDIAVGMFYRAQADASPATWTYWEQQPLSLKLHYQARAKAELAALLNE